MRFDRQTPAPPRASCLRSSWGHLAFRQASEWCCVGERTVPTLMGKQPSSAMKSVVQDHHERRLKGRHSRGFCSCNFTENTVLAAVLTNQQTYMKMRRSLSRRAVKLLARGEPANDSVWRKRDPTLRSAPAQLHRGQRGTGPGGRSPSLGGSLTAQRIVSTGWILQRTGPKKVRRAALLSNVQDRPGQQWRNIVVSCDLPQGHAAAVISDVARCDGHLTPHAARWHQAAPTLAVRLLYENTQSVAQRQR